MVILVSLIPDLINQHKASTTQSAERSNASRSQNSIPHNQSSQARSFSNEKIGQAQPSRAQFSWRKPSHPVNAPTQLKKPSAPALGPSRVQSVPKDLKYFKNSQVSHVQSGTGSTSDVRSMKKGSSVPSGVANYQALESKAGSKYKWTKKDPPELQMEPSAAEKARIQKVPAKLNSPLKLQNFVASSRKDCSSIDDRVKSSQASETSHALSSVKTLKSHHRTNADDHVSSAVASPPAKSTLALPKPLMSSTPRAFLQKPGPVSLKEDMSSSPVLSKFKFVKSHVSEQSTELPKLFSIGAISPVKSPCKDHRPLVVKSPHKIIRDSAQSLHSVQSKYKFVQTKAADSRPPRRRRYSSSISPTPSLAVLKLSTRYRLIKKSVRITQSKKAHDAVYHSKGYISRSQLRAIVKRTYAAASWKSKGTPFHQRSLGLY